jgi:outer membrane lipoprotein SlyB
MAIQTINLGTYANDGTGDDLRVAFQKVNANILELYSTVYGANVGSVPPISGVEQGELWWSTVEGRMYVYYNGAWIDASPVDGFVTYDITAEPATGGASVRLNGTDLSQDSIKFASSINVTDTNTITISSESYTGNVVGNLLGNVQGNVVGNLVGNTNGTHNGAVIGNVTGDVLGDTDGLHTGPVIGNVTGNVTGDTTGFHTGNVVGNVTGNILGDTIGLHTGNVTGNVTGNAGTVTNGVYTNDSYADPTWITSLAGSKVSGNISGNAGSVTNGVYTTGDQTIGGTKTFSNKITGSISGNADGNAGSVTNGVYTTGDQTIGGTKTFSSTISGNISGNAGSVTNGVYTSSSVNALSDVDTVSVAPANGQSLVWDSVTSQWKPGTIAPGGVTKIIAGTNISISPTNGLGDVTINSTGGAGGSLDFGTFSAPAGFSLDLGTF